MDLKHHLVLPVCNMPEASIEKLSTSYEFISMKYILYLYREKEFLFYRIRVKTCLSIGPTH